MKILLNIFTHGNEILGQDVEDEISKLGFSANDVTIHVANKKARELNVRFVESDLNRSFPGKVDGTYEERLALEILPVIQRADLVIDIHSTTSELKDTIIVEKLNQKILDIIKYISPKNLLFMNTGKDTALISHAKIGIAFEYGKSNDAQVVENTVRDVKRIIEFVGIKKFNIPESTYTTNYYEVTGTVPKPEGFKPLLHIENYVLIKKGDNFASNGTVKLKAKEDFYPILFGENSYKDYFGFSATKLDITTIANNS